MDKYMKNKAEIKKSEIFPCDVVLFNNINLKLDSGYQLENFQIHYQTYGKLNKYKSNAILICHALTADQFVADTHPITKKNGWWENMVGPKKPIDTDKYFVICSNVLGGCIGTTGPKELNPKNKLPYGLEFPAITIKDMVKAQKLLIDALEIKSHNPTDTNITQIDSVAIPPKISETNIENDNNPLLKGYTGNWIEYYDNGALKCVIEYMNGLKHGKANYYDEEKRLIRTERYLSGKKHGKWIWYWGNKKVKEVGYYNTDKKQGKWFKYDSNGNEILLKNFY